MIFIGLLGLAMIYSTAHFFVLQRKLWDRLTPYEKGVTIFAIGTICLTYLGLMFGE